MSEPTRAGSLRSLHHWLEVIEFAHQQNPDLANDRKRRTDMTITYALDQAAAHLMRAAGMCLGAETDPAKAKAIADRIEANRTQ